MKFTSLHIVGTGIFVLIALLLAQHITHAPVSDDDQFQLTRAFTHERIWQIEVANTDVERALGLGERETLPTGNGMLFLFEQPSLYGFWMKGMRFPIDIIFLYQGKVVFIERAIQPSDPRIIFPPTVVDQVLEVNVREADGLELGDWIWYWRSFMTPGK